MVRIKVCGITRLEDAQMAVDQGFDAIAFNFYPKSKRYIPPEQAREIIRRLPPFTQLVGVFVNEPLDALRAAAAAAGVGAVQLHGTETPEYCGQITLPVIKSFGMDPNFDFEKMKAYRVSAFLLDTFSSELAGGTGQIFDWKLAIKAKKYGNIILAGGLSPYNLLDALQTVEPYAVDVNSGVETRPGEKTAQKMKQIIDIVRQFNK
jgi:phosphoribosylanthranilate isomerase